MNVLWYSDALDDWRRLSLTDAETVAKAVRRWANGNEGVVVAVGDEYLLFVGDLVVVFFVHASAMHIAHIRRG